MILRWEEYGMEITKEQVRHVAKLSKLSPDEAQLDTLQHDLSRILSAMENLPQDAGDATERRSHCVIREDTVVPSLDRTQLLANAPVQNGESIVVPKTVE
jgi:aspartyl-tRNA(Asn)/glutamyl-tRNA(Gln) amidotransferase subunit C